MSEARARLKEAVSRCSELTSTIQTLKGVQQTAEQQIEAAKLLIESFADLDAQISQFKVDAMKRKENPRALPPELKTRIDDRRSAHDELQWARSALEQVTKDLATAQVEFAAAKARGQAQAIAVLHETGETLADELFELNAKRLDLVRNLQGLSEVCSRDSTIFGLGKMERFRQAMNLQVESDPEWPSIEPHRAYGKRWDARLGALLNNPEAEVTIPKRIHPSDVINLVNPVQGISMSLALRFDLKPEE